MKKTMLDELEDQLMDSILRVKSSNDTNSDENEKMSIEQAHAISGLASRIIDSHKVKAQAMAILAKADNFSVAKRLGEESGLLQLEQGGN